MHPISALEPRPRPQQWPSDRSQLAATGRVRRACDGQRRPQPGNGHAPGRHARRAPPQPRSRAVGGAARPAAGRAREPQLGGSAPPPGHGQRSPPRTASPQAMPSSWRTPLNSGYRSSRRRTAEAHASDNAMLLATHPHTASATARQLSSHCGRRPSAPSPPTKRATGIDKSVLAIAAPRRYRNRDHLRFVAQQPCLICGRKPSDPHHLRHMQPAALGRKASDEFAVPLCRTHHRAAHRAGDERAWWKASGIDPIKAARKLWKETRLNEGRIRPDSDPASCRRGHETGRWFGSDRRIARSRQCLTHLTVARHAHRRAGRIGVEARAVSHPRRHGLCRRPHRRPPGNLGSPQQAAAGLAAAPPLRGDWGGPARCRRFVQRSICSRPAPNSMLPSGRSMSASPSMPAASISTSPMRAGVRSRSGRTAGR